MNRIQINSSEEFEQSIEKMEAAFPNIREALRKEKQNSMEISGTTSWKGKSQEALYRKYKALEANFDPLEEGIALYIRFLKKTLEDYKALEQSIDRKAEEQSNELNVNS